MPKAKNKTPVKSEPIFRHWIEVRDLKAGSVRQLSLKTVVKICLARKSAEPDRPRQELLQVVDGSETVEAKHLDDLAAQLRQKYPDDTHVRTLHWQRDPQAEERRAQAMNSLAEILLPRAYLEALYVIQAELEREGSDPKVPDTELERGAARRGIAIIDLGKRKQRDTWIHLPPSRIREILERFASGETSLLEAPTQYRHRKKTVSLSP